MATVQQYIEKLNATNYVSWARDVKYLLIERNCWDIVTEKEKAPVVDSTTEASVQTAKDLKDYQARTRIALSILYMNIEAEFRSIVETYDNAIDVWKVLKSHYQPDNRARHMALFSELLACRLKPDEKIDLFSSRLKRISEELKSIKQPLPEIYLSFQLIRHLPEEYDPVVQTILRWSDENFTYNDILLQLIAEESRLHLRQQDREGNWNPEVQFARKKVKCKMCGKFGHLQRQCRNNQRNRTSSPSTFKSSSPDRRRPDIQKQESYARNFSRPSRRQWYENNYKPPSKDYHTDKSGPSGTFSLFTQANFSQSNCDEKGWVFDSAASHHFCRDKSLFITFEPAHERMSVAAEGVTYPIEGKGTIMLSFGNKDFKFSNVMYVPKLKRNLISGPQLDVKGVKFSGGGGKVKVTLNDITLFTAFLDNGIYFLYPNVPDKTPNKIQYETSISGVNEIEKWHKRFAHVSPDLIENTSKSQSVNGLPQVRRGNFSCEVCKINKQKRVSFKPINKTRSRRPLELLVMDIWGPAKNIGRNGEKYFLSIIDDFSRKVAVYPLQSKADVFTVFKQHVIRAERFLDTKVKTIRSDNGTEFVNYNFSQFCRNNGIKHELTNVYSPEQNGICERFNQTILNGIRTILDESGLKRSFWPEAALYFSYTWNRVCHKNQTKTPFELYGGNQPSVKHLKPFGITAFVGVPKQNRSKFDARAKRGVFVGYAFRTKGYRIWLPSENKIIETINVSFKENIPENAPKSGAVLGSYNRYEVSNFEHGTKSDGYSESEKVNPQYTLVPYFEQPESSEDEEEETIIRSSRDVIAKTPLRTATWIREAKTRRDNTRTDIYYYEQGKTLRLRSPNEVEKYCKKNHIKFEPSIFDFKGKNTYEGIIRDPKASSSSSCDSTEFTGDDTQ